MEKVEHIVHIDAPFFNAGIVVRAGTVIMAAPIIKYMRGWTEKRALEYCKNRGWSAVRHPAAVDKTGAAG